MNEKKAKQFKKAKKAVLAGLNKIAEGYDSFNEACEMLNEAEILGEYMETEINELINRALEDATAIDWPEASNSITNDSEGVEKAFDELIDVTINYVSLGELEETLNNYCEGQDIMGKFSLEDLRDALDKLESKK